MTAAELRRIGEALYGPRWATNLARDLGVAKRTVNRLASGERGIPAGMPGELLDLMRARRTVLLEEMKRLYAAQREAAASAASVGNPAIRASQNR